MLPNVVGCDDDGNTRNMPRKSQQDIPTRHLHPTHTHTRKNRMAFMCGIQSEQRVRTQKGVRRTNIRLLCLVKILTNIIGPSRLCALLSPAYASMNTCTLWTREHMPAVYMCSTYQHTYENACSTCEVYLCCIPATYAYDAIT